MLVTSPLPSNPSTELLDHTLASFPLKCRTWVVSDGYRLCAESQKPRLKSGRIGADRVEAYEAYRTAPKAASSLDWRSCLDKMYLHLRAPSHKGFAGCLHIALRKVSTPYVLVLQHDRPCLRGFNALHLIEAEGMVSCAAHCEAMEQLDVKYLGLPTKVRPSL